jgi:DNA-binding transcriptional MocR family regulator
LARDIEPSDNSLRKCQSGPMGFWDDFGIEGRPGPKYVAIRDALADAIRNGSLGPGRRLPSHRMMAIKLGVSAGTVTRAYTLALDQGLISGEIGRGTFVRYLVPLPLSVVDSSRTPAGCLDLYQNLPVEIPEVEDEAWATTLRELESETRLSTMARVSWSEVSPRHRRAGASWIRRAGLAVSQRNVFDCPGLMSALCAIVGATTSPGDLLVAPVLSHPLVKLLAEQYSLKLHGLPIDEHGIELDAFETVCRENRPRLLYCSPTIHSPTTTTSPEQRRQAIAELAQRYDLLILEDEYAAFLLPEPLPPISSFAPERSFFVGDVWLALSLGLRTTYVAVPDDWMSSLARAIASTSGVTPPLIAEIATRWIETETADRLIEARRNEIGARNVIAREILGDRRLRSDPLGHHVWLELVQPWTSDLFVLRAQQRGIALNPAEWFAIGHESIPQGVRISIGNAPDRARLRWALGELRQLLDEAADW